MNALTAVAIVLLTLPIIFFCLLLIIAIPMAISYALELHKQNKAERKQIRKFQGKL